MNKNIKQFIYLIGIILIIVVGFITLAKNQNMIVIQEGNVDKTPYKLTLGKYQDSDCGMVIDNFDFVSQVVSSDGKTWFFHDHGGMAHWLINKTFKDEAVIWVMSKDTKKYIDGRKAWYSRTDITPMGYGFGAYENKQEGFIDFPTMFLHMARGEHFGNPQIKAKLLEGRK
ncbi:MAG: hypothetical protein RBT59_09715 [Arcobacteraceae bacterium]|jgi:hypothetical protein|nr:hypothetical protein [Arcobacteraceae bacterium]